MGRSRGGLTTKIHMLADTAIYKHRNRIERCFNKLGTHINVTPALIAA